MKTSANKEWDSLANKKGENLFVSHFPKINEAKLTKTHSKIFRVRF